MDPARSGSSAAPAQRSVAIALDLLILVLAALVCVVALTGGGVADVAGIRIRARTVENPTWILTALVALRYALRAWGPFLGYSTWPMERAIESGASWTAVRLPALAGRLAQRPPHFIALLAAAVLAIKMLLGWTSPGFFSGDDVEIHEMSLGALLGKAWPIWDLRCALYPMAFVYPAQRLAFAIGASEPETLVFAGRMAVAVVSTAVLPLTWLAARRLVPDDPRVAAAAVVLVAINKLLVSFGSSELPRPVAAVFVLAAFVVTLRGGVWAAAAAGALLGTAAAMRFSEIVFLAPAVVVLLLLRREPARAVIMVVATGASAAALIGVADALYWGAPWSSVRAAVAYTLVERQSSRGFQPPWEYLRIVPAWTTALFVALAAAGSRRTNPDAWWCWVPIGLLSLLPHKESRYLIPVVPFFSIAAARGLLQAADWIRGQAPQPGPRRWIRDLLAPLLLLSVLHEIGGWRLPRSNEGIRLARYLRESRSAGLAVQDPWRLGGRPYLWRHDPLVEVSPPALADPAALAEALTGVRLVALRSRTARTTGDEVLRALGFDRDPSWVGEDYVLFITRDPMAR